MCAAKRAEGQAEYYRVMEDLQKRFPRFKLVPKEDSSLMKVIHFVLRVISFNQMLTFMSSFTTTIGYTIYTPSTWAMQGPYSRACTLRHEGVHMDQLSRMGFLKFAFLYLFFPLPIVLAIGRMLLEQEAYEETLRAYVEYFGLRLTKEDTALRSRIVGHFVGASYLWTWPFRKNVERWYDDFMWELEQAHDGD